MARRRLLLRVYFHGIVLLVLSVSASSLVGKYVVKPAFDGPMRPSTSYIAWRMSKLGAEHPLALEGELRDLKRRVGIEMSVYAPDGRLLGTNAARPPTP